jgi:hypothetical protein
LEFLLYAMNYKSFILFLLAIAVILTFYGIPSYNDWIQKKIFTVSDIGEQARHLNPEERKAARFGYTYIVLHDIAIKLAAEKNTTILLPPDPYLQAMHVKDFKMVEPAEFYYFTGLNTVTVTSPGVWGANWAFIAQDGRLSLQKIASRQQLDEILSVFKRYQH